jgi:hypothetical protein
MYSKRPISKTSQKINAFKKESNSNGIKLKEKRENQKAQKANEIE